MATVSLAVLLNAAGCGADERPQGAISFEDDNGNIRSVSASGGRSVVLMAAHEGDPDDYADPSLSYYGAAWSRSGRLLATVATDPSEGQGWTDLSVLRPEEMEVTNDQGPFNEQPSWGPGDAIVYVSVQYTIPRRLGELRITSTAGARSSEPRHLTEGSADGDPAWSPDGKLIAFVRNQLKGPPLRLYLIQPDGHRLRQLTDSFGENPTWAPDSRTIAFDDGHRIVVTDVNGGGHRYLTKGPSDKNPAWSPTGKWIAFEHGKDVWLTDDDGAHSRKVVDSASNPSWQQQPQDSGSAG